MAETFENIVSSFGSAGQITDVSSKIYAVNFTETALLNIAQRGVAKTVKTSWEQDKLRTTGENAHVEGAKFKAKAVAPLKRIDNICQIFRGDISLSRTALKETYYAPDMLRKRTLAKEMTAIMNDMEYAFWLNQEKDDSGTDAEGDVVRKTGGLIAYLNENVQAGTGGVNPKVDGSIKRVDAADANMRFFTSDMLGEALINIYEQGGSPSHAFMPPRLLDVAADFTGSLNRTDERATKDEVRRKISVYITNFGEIMVMPALRMRSRDVVVMDPDQIEIRDFDPLSTTYMGRQGDSIEWMAVAERALCVRNSAGIALITDLKPGKATT